MNISEKAGKVVLHCHAGCPQPTVFEAARARNLLGETPHSEIVAEYDYTDEAGKVLYQVVRMAPKDFRQRTPDGAGGWRWGLNGTRPTLYRLPDVALAIRMGEPVYVTEGEKDADALRAKGLIATTSSGGAGKWRAEYAESLRGARVVVVQDKDEAGYRHAADVYATLTGIAASVRVVEAITGKDAFDHLAAGHSVDDFAPAKPIHPPKEHWQLGGPFILDAPEVIPCLWGRDDEIIMAAGESLFIVGPSGVGKSTLSQQLLLAFAGLRNDVLGFPVVPAQGTVLYLAMDRPQQIRRSLRRMVIEEDRGTLNAKLRFWPGPLHFNALDKPEELLDLCRAVGATHLFVDSLKDLAIAVAKDEVAAQVNRLFQYLSVADIQLVVVHHQRKAQGDNKKPTSLADVYGNFQLTAGAGSVILLWGEPGDTVIDLDHLKQPRSPVGPFQLTHSHDLGFSEVENAPGDALEILRSAAHGLVAEGIARYMFGTEKPTRAQVERARRRADNLAAKSLVYSANEPSSINTKRPIVRYYAAENRYEKLV
ncbi:MAG: AAA family ATPase [Gemmatimonadales bacterium]|nr:AAA family ATPase [Gemmatimonadales bacterium]